MSNNEFIEEEYIVNIYADIERNLRSYSGFASLLRELIQNSDDSSTDGKDVEIEVHFLKDKLILKNNTSFSENDWKKIREIGSRNKEGDSSKTGRFGIGFTSAFKISDKISIHSNNVSKCVDLNIKTDKKWLINPKPRYLNQEVTEFEFFWRSEDSEARREINAEIITPSKIQLFIKEVLDNIHRDIHFLNHVTKLDIYSEGGLIHRIRISDNVSNLAPNIDKQIKTISVDGEDQRFLIYHNNIENDFKNEFDEKIARRKPLLLSVALNTHKIQKGRMFCTLPTEIITGFSFDINCDFQPDQNRKQLIFEKDDAKGRYNLKILKFIPDLLYDIIDDIKKEVPYEFLCEVLAYTDNSNKHAILFSDFINKIKENDHEIIYLSDEWHHISKTRISNEKSILPILLKFKYPIIPHEYLHFNHFFNEIGVQKLSLDDVINFIRINIPNSIPFEKSIFESENELYSIFSFISENFNINYTNSLKELNIFLTETGYLENNRNNKIVDLPVELDPIKDDLPIKQIDKNLAIKYKRCLINLGIEEFTYDDLISMIATDFSNIHYPIVLSKASPYINSKEKLLVIISFIMPSFYNYEAYLKAEQLGEFLYNGRRLKLNDPFVTQIKETIHKIKNLPILLSEQEMLYSLNDDKVFILNSEYQQQFADVVGLKKLEYEVSDTLKIFRFNPRLSLNKITDFFRFYLENRSPDTNEIILFYQLISKNRSELNEQNMRKIKEMCIFKNNKGELCALNNDERDMLLQGSYPVPEGIQIDDILDEDLINNVPSFPNFKKEILESSFNIKRLNIDSFILNYFPSIFNENVVSVNDKCELVKKLNEEFLKLKKQRNYPEIRNILLNSNLILCNDGKFHSPSKVTIFFKSKELDQVLGADYLFPKYVDKDIGEYENLYRELGVKEKLDDKTIEKYIKQSVKSYPVDESLINKMRNLFIYINNNWESFNNVHHFEVLANIEWLPATGKTLKLYKPSELYLQNSDETQTTRTFLSELKHILYLDITDKILLQYSNSKRIKRDLVRSLNLNNVEKISTDDIISNLKLLSDSKKLIRNPSVIYTELEKRSKQNPHLIRSLSDFNSIYIKYEDELTPRYFSPLEVFLQNHKDSYGYEYIGYLSVEFVYKCKNLMKILKIANEPNISAIKEILSKIEQKYESNNYYVSDDLNKKIIANCLKQLSNNYENLDFDETISSSLRSMHILCNDEGQLITPEYAILDDNQLLSAQFKDKLGSRFVRYNMDYINLIQKLSLNKISQLVHKKLVSEPKSVNLDQNQEFTQRIKLIAKLIPRIKIGNNDQLNQNNDWKDICADINVWNFEDLQVSKYIVIGGNKCSLEDNSDSCYIEPGETAI